MSRKIVRAPTDGCQRRRASILTEYLIPLTTASSLRSVSTSLPERQRERKRDFADSKNVELHVVRS